MISRRAFLGGAVLVSYGTWVALKPTPAPGKPKPTTTVIPSTTTMTPPPTSTTTIGCVGIPAAVPAEVVC